jgi:aminoglycoside phosphotransferase (APT) family kinase protein
MALAPTFPWLDLHLWLSSHMPGYTQLEWLSTGFNSTVYSVFYQAQYWALRFASKPESFVREHGLRPALVAQGIPVPELHEIGQWKHGYYALSTRCLGQDGWSLSPHERLRQALPLLLVLHQWRPQPGAVYPLKPAQCQSLAWPQFLLTPVAGYGQMTPVNQAYMAEHVPLYGQLIDTMKALQGHAHVPDFQGLLHGDMNASNFLTDGQQVVAMLDWDNFLWGDFVYDWAKLLLLSESPAIFAHLGEIEQAYAQAGFNVSDFYARFILSACRVAQVRLTVPVFKSNLERIDWAMHNLQWLFERGPEGLKALATNAPGAHTHYNAAV